MQQKGVRHPIDRRDGGGIGCAFMFVAHANGKRAEILSSTAD